MATPARGQTSRRAPYVRLFTVLGVTGASDLRIRQSVLGTDLTFEQVSWEHKSLSTEWTRDAIPYVGARLGFCFREPRWLGVSVEVLHFKIFAEQDQLVRVRGVNDGRAVDTTAPFSQFVHGYQVSNGVNMVLGNLQAHRRMARSGRFPDGRVDVYGGLGRAFPCDERTDWALSLSSKSMAALHGLAQGRRQFCGGAAGVSTQR